MGKNLKKGISQLLVLVMIIVSCSVNVYANEEVSVESNENVTIEAVTEEVPVEDVTEGEITADEILTETVVVEETTESTEVVETVESTEVVEETETSSMSEVTEETTVEENTGNIEITEVVQPSEVGEDLILVEDWVGATNLSFNTTVYNAIEDSYYDSHWYKITLPYDGKIDCNILHTLYDTSATYWRVTIRNSSQTFLDEWYVYGNSTVAFLNTGLEAGTYYIVVNAYYVSEGMEYGINVAYEQSNYWENEYTNDSSVGCKTIELGKDYYGRIYDYYNDGDWYKVNLLSDGKVDINLKHNFIDSSDSYWRVILYNANFTHLNTYYVSGNSDVAVRNLGLAEGTYYIKIDGYSNSTYKVYRLNVGFESSSYWENEFTNNNSSGCKIMEPLKTYSGKIYDYYNDTDWYKFVVTDATNDCFEFETDYISSGYDKWKLYLYKDTPSNSYKTWTVEANCLAFTTTTLPVGTYYLKVTGYYNSNNYLYKITQGSSWGYYKGDVNTELQSVSYDPNTGYVSGQIVVVEWVNGVSTVPPVKPVMSFKSTDGTEELDVFVTPTGTNTYYFDRKLDGLTPGKEYIFSVTSGSYYNVSEYKTVPVYTGTSSIGSTGVFGNLLTQSMCFKTGSDGSLLLFGADRWYQGNINSSLGSVSCVSSNSGNFVSGNIVITEWIGSSCIVPKTTPKITFESVDGTESLDVFITSIDGSNTYYFDRNLSGTMDTSKQYVFRITLTEPYNASATKSMIATTNYMNAKSGTLWETSTQIIKYKTVWANNDNQLRIYAVNK